MSSNSSLNSKNNRQELVDELQFLGQMASTETALFHHKVAEKNGLGITDVKTISTLMQEGPMTAGQLAERLSLTTGAITNLIDRLERTGLVKRSSDPDDRRKVVVKVDEMSMARNMEHAQDYESIGRAFQKQLQKYTLAELEFLVAYYKASIDITRQEIAKVGKDHQARAIDR